MVEELRKEGMEQLKKQEIHFGIVSKQVNLKQNLGNKRKGGGLLVKTKVETTN